MPITPPPTSSTSHSLDKDDLERKNDAAVALHFALKWILTSTFIAYEQNTFFDFTNNYQNLNFWNSSPFMYDIYVQALKLPSKLATL